jgi:hypothetical protein
MEWRDRVAAATVVTTRKEGQGVLVTGGFILTAAHCISWDHNGGMALGDHFVEPITTRDGSNLHVGPWVVEPVSDIAVLGELDNQVFFEQCDAFEEWRESVQPIAVSDRVLQPQESIAVHVLSHKGHWIAGKATRHGHGAWPRLWIETASCIEGGTSGGPIVDEEGKLLGVVSWGNEDGAFPVACLALPSWIWQRINQAAED